MNAIIILAAGPSIRLGKPKQNLCILGDTLLKKLINEANLISKLVVVILGANIQLIEPTLKGLEVKILNNENWHLGMSSSIRHSVTFLQSAYKQLSSITFLVCDQPFVKAELLHKLINTARSSVNGIIACTYGETIGVPVLFKAAYFYELCNINGKQGAKQLLEKYSGDVAVIPFPLGLIDIDTEEDLLNYHDSSSLIKSRPEI